MNDVVTVYYLLRRVLGIQSVHGIHKKVSFAKPLLQETFRSMEGKRQYHLSKMRNDIFSFTRTCPIEVCSVFVSVFFSLQNIHKVQFTYLKTHKCNRFEERHWQTSAWPFVNSETEWDILLQGKNKPTLEPLEHLQGCPRCRGSQLGEHRPPPGSLLKVT